MIKRIAITALVATSVSACVSVQEARDVAMPATNAKTFTFDKNPAEGITVTKYEVNRALENGIKKASPHNSKCQTMCRWREKKQVNYHGAIIERGDAEFTLTYRKGYTYPSTAGLSLTKTFYDIIAKMPYSIDEKGDSWVVKVSAPTSIHKTRGNDDWFLFKTNEEVFAQYNELMTKLKPIHRERLKSNGEFKVNYDPRSVVTSLNRKLQPLTKTKEGSGGFSATYKLKHNSQFAKAEVKVYLNKGTSLVEFSISQDVIVDGKGSSSYDSTAMKAFKQQLIDAANS